MAATANLHDSADELVREDDRRIHRWLLHRQNLHACNVRISETAGISNCDSRCGSHRQIHRQLTESKAPSDGRSMIYTMLVESG
eukprot:scaffold152259_cov54-Prasinocladus_malaysianus.AAC.2